MQIEELNKNIKILTDERRELKVQLEDTVKAFKEVEDDFKKLNTRNVIENKQVNHCESSLVNNGIKICQKELESKKTVYLFTGTEFADKVRELKECQTENQRLRDLFNDDGQTIVVLVRHFLFQIDYILFGINDNNYYYQYHSLYYYHAFYF